MPGLLDYETTNAVLAWALIGALAVIALLRSLDGEYLGAALAASVAALAAAPSIASGRPRRTVAWEVLALAVAPLLAPQLGFLRRQATYVTVAAVGLLVAVELDAFTDVRMTPDFAVAFVVVVTMALSGLWVIVRYASDSYLGTAYLRGVTPLMWDLVVATVVGVAAGVVFEVYFRRRDSARGFAREPRGEAP